MARGGPDGSINVDTKVNEKGFNSGAAGISNAFTRLGRMMGGTTGRIVSGIGSIIKILGTVVTVIGVIIGVVAVLAVAAVGAGIAIYKWAQKMTNALYQNLSAASAFRSQVVALKQGFDSVKGSLMSVGATMLSIIAPAIQKIISWLVTAINWVNQFIAALAGKNTYMKYVSGSADSAGSAAKNTNKLAANTKKATKEARGALAAFDEINVLQKETADMELEDPTSGGGGGAGGNVVMEEVAIDSKISGIVEKVRNAWLAVKEALAPVFEWIKINVIDPIWSKILWLWGIISESASALWNGGLKDVFNIFITFIRDFFVGNLKAGFDMVKNIFKTLLTAVTGIITSVIQILGGVIEFVTGVFTGDWEKAWQGIQDIFKGLFNGIASIVEGVVNVVIDLINGMIEGVVSGVNAVIKALNTVKIDIPAMFGKPAFTWGINLSTLTAPQIKHVEIPHLATGAVIPPNSEFMAILGDQKSGRNLEMPEALLEEMLDRKLGDQQININFGGSLGELVRMLKPEIDRENSRMGTSLISSGARS